MALPRPRLPFRHPSETEHPSPATPLDEIQQENVISALTRENASQNLAYTRALLALLCASALVPLGSLRSTPIGALLSLTCLGAHAYTLLLPLPQGPDRDLDSGSRYAVGGGWRSKGKRPVRNRWDVCVGYAARWLDLDLQVGAEGPWARWVPVGAMWVGILLAVEGTVLWAPGGDGTAKGLRLFVPAVMGLVVSLGRRWMRGVDVGHMEGLKYELKGA